jgi:putative ABC transport system permease protein
MISHVLKLIWNRRRGNRLVVVEIAAAFVVTFVLAALAVNLWSNYQRPLGFVYESIWSVTATHTTASGFAALSRESHSDTLADILAALRALPRTEAVEPIQTPPFILSARLQSYTTERDAQISARINQTTANGLRMLGVTLVDGRIFSPEDEGQNYRAVLVNRTFVERVFGPGQDVVGRRIEQAPLILPGMPQPTEEVVAQWRQGLREERIVGVIDDFRQWGEFADSHPVLITRHESADEQGLSFSLMLEVASGTDAGFEEDIVRAVESVAPGWVAEVTPWAQLREDRHRMTLLPLKVAATLAAFFIALVVMGLIGVLWQDVVRRTQEIGLRRALGAGAGAVRRQIQLEMLVVGAFGVLIGVAVAIQFPLLMLVERIDWASGIPGLALAAALILALVALGALYPSWLASRREPADALRYE